MYNFYKMLDEPELYNFRTEKIDEIIKDWFLFMKEAKKEADFNNLANTYFSE